MQDKALFALVAVAVIAVSAILVAGIGSFARGGDYARRNSNRLMRWRIIAQAIAIALILLYIAVVGG